LPTSNKFLLGSLTSRNGFSVDICVKGNEQLSNMAKLIENSPRDLIFIVDHIAKPFIKETDLEPWRQLMSEISKHDNVFCKLSGNANSDL
jgi:L-fuconolactonase